MSDFFVTIQDPQRAARATAVFGSNILPVVSPQYRLVPVKGLRGLHAVYLVDLDSLDADVRANALALLSSELGIAESEIVVGGVPVQAENVILSIHNPVQYQISIFAKPDEDALDEDELS